MPEPNTNNQTKTRDTAEEQRIMAEAMGGNGSPDNGDGLMNDSDAATLYKKLYGGVDAETDQLTDSEVPPHQTRNFFMNGMSSDNVPQPEIPVEGDAPEFSDEEKNLLAELGTDSTETITTPEPPPADDGSEVANLRSQVAQLQQKLQQQLDAGTTTPDPAPPPAEAETTPPTADKEVDKDLLTLDTILQKRFGLNLKQVYEQLSYSNQVVDYVGQMQANQKLDTMKSELKDSWGDEYDYRFGKAQELYNTLPDKQKTSIDGLGSRGAELLWAKVLEQETQPNVPNFDRGKTSTTKVPSDTASMVTSKELLELSDEEYSREMQPGGRLWNAAVKGNVNYDM